MLFSVLLAAAIMSTAAGCGSTTGSAKTASNNSASASAATVAVPRERPALIGKVKEIVGNEVTVYKSAASPNDGQVSGSSPNGNHASGSSPDGNQTPGSSQNSSNQSSGRNSGARGNWGSAMTFTEETETFMIPVGIPVVSMGGSGSQEINITDIKADQILRVWKTGDAITFVQVMGGNSRSTNSNNNENRTGNRNGNSENRDSGGFGPPPGM